MRNSTHFDLFSSEDRYIFCERCRLALCLQSDSTSPSDERWYSQQHLALAGRTADVAGRIWPASPQELSLFQNNMKTNNSLGILVDRYMDTFIHKVIQLSGFRLVLFICYERLSRKIYCHTNTNRSLMLAACQRPVLSGCDDFTKCPILDSRACATRYFVYRQAWHFKTSELRRDRNTKYAIVTRRPIHSYAK